MSPSPLQRRYDPRHEPRQGGAGPPSLRNAAESLNEFDLDLRKELIIATLNRTDHSGEVLRTLLFAASGAALGLLLYPQQRTADVKLGYHALSAVSFIICAAAVLISWHFQKKEGDKAV
jgi:hypothetical protein